MGCIFCVGAYYPHFTVCLYRCFRYGSLIRCKLYSKRWQEGLVTPLGGKESAALYGQEKNPLQKPQSWLLPWEVLFGTLVYNSKYLFQDWVSKATRPASNNCLHRVQYSSFPPEGVTGTSCYRFEYNLHLVKIPSHLNLESMYRFVLQKP